ncbi:hypothetical protein A2960_00015 [Candidatus Gottesmanbacteria bacterium RIFCSPLOWO2_01_FULL_39_12b]|uniref:Aminotransferase class I/classII domain-containing protein n=1 Tax=Candidatus Gottesmanbacteria bacterium RIFCSPLOWO2_01_FULL_39_12b TaxID=1798388 RepID=A0A1F6ARQ5_9BACT|nr:MAG: hypothetical protein A2960_00015 [Candidatus Gottesmanbacteria bacterium RIFCSPLOWO2_01_FULL_39_12b]
MNQKLIYPSFIDLDDDFIELEYIANSYLGYLKNAFQKISKKKTVLPKKSTVVTLSLQNEWIGKLNDFLNEIKKSKKEAIIKSNNLIDLLQLEKAKDASYYFLRSLSGVIGSLVTATDWQSPGFNHSLYSEAGSQTGKTIATINDYKRDWHLNAQSYEKEYVKEYVEAPFKFLLRALMTNSGMAAFTTIFNFLQMQGLIKSQILMGKSCYFQYKQILKESLKDKVIEVDELKTEEIINRIKEIKPSVIFLDSLSNSKYIPVPNLIKIIDYLKHNYKEEIYLVIDNTGLSVNFQPFKLLGIRGKIHLIVFESLMKYVHLGLDRVTGGVIVAGGADGGKLFECRKHLGTNIADASVYAFPKPNRYFLKNRLQRLQRNASFLASSLQSFLAKQKKCSVKRVIYPGRGSFFNLEFDKNHSNTKNYNRFIKIAVSLAQKNDFQLVAGTSFGLNHTRIYLTSLWSNYGIPFLRISTGTENIRQMEVLKGILIKTMEIF